ncbi:uncharacterized protein [Rutidosis leptorrhynchoides]|uniref:uncharacterized protein n=1 Tax=Rutidosis leptorrhynchoides TaxID=125765 RepID=UPI003A99D6E7
MDPSKVDAIKSWPSPSSITKVKSFHGLASFYRRYIKDFSTIVSSITDCLKKWVFEWSSSAQSAFESLKEKLISAPILTFPNFDMLFELECDASGVGIGVVLVRYSLLLILEARVLGFLFVKELYEADPDFSPILICSPVESKRDYVEQDGFLFKGSILCIPKDSIRELLVKEAHGALLTIPKLMDKLKLLRELQTVGSWGPPNQLPTWASLAADRPSQRPGLRLGCRDPDLVCIKCLWTEKKGKKNVIFGKKKKQNG